MKLALVFVAVLAVSAAAAPLAFLAAFWKPVPLASSSHARHPHAAATRVANSDQAANVLCYDNNVNPNGSYNYVVEIDNGIAAQAQGTPRDFGGNPPVVPIVSKGSFYWTSPEGQLIIITYVADENGYQPSGGDAIPTPPPPPGATFRSLDPSKLQKKDQ